MWILFTSCPSGFYTGMTCEQLTVSCPSTDAITVTVGYVGPTMRSTPLGTIVFFGGGSGTSPAEPNDSMLSFAGDYVQDYTIVNLAWASAWAKARASGTENILLAACRPATLLNWINGSSTFHSAGAMCSQGKSAGSAAIAYSMSWYGADKYLTNVELLAGPVLTEINQGCTYNPPPPDVEMCDGQSWCLCKLRHSNRRLDHQRNVHPRQAR